MTQREAFAAWAKNYIFNDDIKEEAWEVWQAARVQALEEAAKVCEAQNPTGSVNQEWMMERCSGAIRALIGEQHGSR